MDTERKSEMEAEDKPGKPYINAKVLAACEGKEIIMTLPEREQRFLIKAQLKASAEQLKKAAPEEE